MEVLAFDYVRASGPRVAPSPRASEVALITVLNCRLNNLPQIPLRYMARYCVRVRNEINGPLGSTEHEIHKLEKVLQLYNYLKGAPTPERLRRIVQETGFVAIELEDLARKQAKRVKVATDSGNAHLDAFLGAQLNERSAFDKQRLSLLNLHIAKKPRGHP